MPLELLRQEPRRVVVVLDTTFSTILEGVGIAAVGGFATIVPARISRKIKISKFQIDMTDYIGISFLWAKKYHELRSYAEADKSICLRTELSPIAKDALVILRRIRLQLNSRDDNPDKVQNDALLQSLANLLNCGSLDPDHFITSWEQLADQAVEQGREILKREWEVTKPFPVWRRSRQYLVSALHQVKASEASIMPRYNPLRRKYKQG